MKEKDFRIIENKLTGIIKTIIRLMKKETDTKDNWKGTGFFVNTTDDYK